MCVTLYSLKLNNGVIKFTKFGNLTNNILNGINCESFCNFYSCGKLVSLVQWHFYFIIIYSSQERVQQFQNNYMSQIIDKKNGNLIILIRYGVWFSLNFSVLKAVGVNGWLCPHDWNGLVLRLLFILSDGGWNIILNSDCPPAIKKIKSRPFSSLYLNATYILNLT